MNGRLNNRCTLSTPPKPGRPAPADRGTPRKSAKPATTGCSNAGHSIPCSSKKHGFWSGDDVCYVRPLPGQPPAGTPNGRVADDAGSIYVCDDVGFSNRPPSLIRRETPPPTMPVVGADDFQNYPLPAPEPMFQPATWTVTSYRTNIYTEAKVHIIDLTLLGFPVKVRATPVGYSWDFGDGTTLQTTKTGRAVEQGGEPVLHHTYTKTGDVDVVLTTSYRGEFQVDGGAWIPIAGRAAVPSDPVPLNVLRYKRYGVAGTCAEDPAAPDCR